MPPNKNAHPDIVPPVDGSMLARINRRGAALLALTATLVAGTGAIVLGKDSSDPSAHSPLERPPAATAEPFDHTPEVSLPPATLAPAPEESPTPTPSAKPEVQVPTTIAAGPKPAESKTVVGPEVKAPKLLDQETVSHISEKMGYKGLEGRALELGEVIETKTSKVQILRLDGAEQSVSTEKLTEYLAAAESLTARQTSFDTTLQLGTGPATELTFNASSNSRSPEKDMHYVIFAKSTQNLDELTAPIKGFPEASTKVLPYENLAVTLLSDTRGREWEGLQANEYYALTEMIVAKVVAEMDDATIAKIDSGAIDMSNLNATSLQNRKWELGRLGTDIFANSWARAILLKSQGVPYSTYAAQKVPMRAFAALEAFLHTVSPEEFSQAA